MRPPTTAPVRYGSICSGIEAASMAWETLGWVPAWFSEIEAYPSAVLAHHWPTVQNLGDMTQIHHGVESGMIEAPDLLVGGTPCQAFSVAGLRSSLEDARGQLTLHFVGLANAIDTARTRHGLPPAVIVWENVPGVLNTKDNALGCFLGALAGEDVALLPPGGRWTNAGVVIGPARAIAWRILDAQYFGVAQRRRRVFVVASARDGFCPDEALLEFDGLRRDSAPSREAGKGFAADLAPCLVSSGRGVERVGDTRGQNPVVAVCVTGDIFHTLRAEGFDASEDGAGKDVGAVAVAHVQVLPTMTSGGPKESCHGQVSGQMREAYIVPVLGFNARQGPDVWEGRTGPLDTDGGTQGVLVGIGSPVLSTHENQRHELSLNETAGTVKCAGGKPGQGYPAALIGARVRRLTPTECERLQGFPDGHTLVPWRGKISSDCPDGPRYKALGNSMCVAVMHWIGARIHQQLETLG